MKHKNSMATRLLFGDEGLDEILRYVDYLINILPHTGETVGLLNGMLSDNIVNNNSYRR